VDFISALNIQLRLSGGNWRMSIWRVGKAAAMGFIDNGALSRGAAIAFYTATSLSPLLLIVIAVSALVMGQDVARAAVAAELDDLVGSQGAELMKSIIARSSDPTSGTVATVLGVLAVLVTASGVFGEMQTALNVTWGAKPSDLPFWSLIRARATGIGLVAALGFMLIVSLAASAAISALGQHLGSQLAVAKLLISILNTLISLILFTFLFAAIYKVLPDAPIDWRDVGAGALLTATLFTVGKSAIGWYLGYAAPSSPYGAAGGLVVLMLWTYYAAQIFLFGAELTKAVADVRKAGRANVPALSWRGRLARRQRPRKRFGEGGPS
jgi:membrane protein